jgi:3-phosphoshikimate 1-carboxyvinyltransferase
VSFAFVGQLPASKSMLNRLLIAQSYAPQLKIHGDSRCEDVEYMKKALAALPNNVKVREFDVGAGGTTLRFLALRAARSGGEFILRGTRRLFERPQDDLLKILRQLSIETEIGPDFLRLSGSGWKLQGDTLLVPFARSSQFASAVLLNAWDLPFDLFVSLGGQKVSEGYWRMSVRMAHDLGMKMDFWDGDFRVPKGQTVSAREFTAETDLSSAFAVAAVAAVSGSASFTDFPTQSLQPDAEFVRILGTMGVPLALSGQTLKVERAARLNGVAVNLRACPDLFPVLSALCALAEGDSHLYGATQLAHKESNRIQKMAEMIRAFGREAEANDDGLYIRGAALKPASSKNIEIDCDHDHRVAFAAAVYRAAGFGVDILNPEVVNKSFPEFWSILR